MSKTNLLICLLFIMNNYFHYAITVKYNPYDTKLLRTTNSDNGGYDAQQYTFNENQAYQQNLQENRNNQQMNAYYYTRPYEQQQQQLLPQQPTQFWSGPPIVVEDNLHSQQQSSTNIPPTFFQQHSTSNIIRSSELLPFIYRNSNVIPPTIYNPQPTTATAKINYNNNNNKNIVYHRDFSYQIDAIPESQRTPEVIAYLNNQQQQHWIPQQQQSKQFYDTNTNLNYKGISNDLTLSRKGSGPDYREHFTRYLENNPNRIEPIY